MNLRDACEEAIECLEMWVETDAEKRGSVGVLGTRMVINHIVNALADSKDDVPAATVAAWRHNYRTTLQALHDENNVLRSTAGTLGAQLSALRSAIEPKKWWQLWR
jgi:hypothetical protein